MSIRELQRRYETTSSRAASGHIGPRYSAKSSTNGRDASTCQVRYIAFVVYNNLCQSPHKIYVIHVYRNCYIHHMVFHIIISFYSRMAVCIHVYNI